jgi:hypothetical protein
MRPSNLVAASFDHNPRLARSNQIALVGLVATDRAAVGPTGSGSPGESLGRVFEAELADAGITLIRPARAGEPTRPGERFLKPLRQIIESINDTLKGQLDLERHGGRTIAGVCTRVAQRLLALTAAIWHNDRLGLPIRRSLIAYDH